MSQAGLRLARRLALGALVTLPAGAAAEEAASPRADLERFEWALDRAVRKVSRPSAAPILGGAEACRGYHINGYGALFVLTPRSLPVRPRTAHESPPQPAVVAPPPALRGRLEKMEAERRRKARLPSDKETADDLLALEAQVAALQRAAETARAEAEAALEETTRELHQRLLSSTLGTPLPPLPPGVPGTPASAERTPPPPTPPWRFWTESEEPEEARTPERVVEDVRTAVTEVLETQGPPLRLGGDELVVVVVDFLPRSAFATRTRPARTLVVRVRKRELDARASGQLAAEDLRKRIEYSEY
jgi:hypothetical protein